jgi:hypothetical protein
VSNEACPLLQRAAAGAGGAHGRGKAVGLSVPLLGGVALPAFFAGQRRTAQQKRGQPKGWRSPGEARRVSAKRGEYRATWGVRGVSPRESTASHRRRRPKVAKYRATPGGYGGKPPGVASSAFRRGPGTPAVGAPTGDRSTDMNRTRKHPPLCQDLITTKSRDGNSDRSVNSKNPFRYLPNVRLIPPHGSRNHHPPGCEWPGGSAGTP